MRSSAAVLPTLCLLAAPALAQIETVIPSRFPLDMEVSAGRIYFVEESGEFQVRPNEVWKAWPFTTPLVANPDLVEAPVAGTAFVEVNQAYAFGVWADDVPTRQAIYGELGELGMYLGTELSGLAVDDDWVWTSERDLFLSDTLRRQSRTLGGSATSESTASVVTNSLVAPGNGGAYYIGTNTSEVDSIYVWFGSGFPIRLESINAPATAMDVDDEAQYVWWGASASADLPLPAVIRTHAQTGPSDPLHVINDADAVITDIAVDDTNAYFIFQPGPGLNTVLRRVPLVGGAHTDMADLPPSAHLLREDGSFLYWVDSIGVRRILKDASVSRPDLRWARSRYIEGVQAIQGRFEETHPEFCELVQDRLTMVRAWPRTDTGTLERVQARLHGFYPGTEIELPGSPVSATLPFQSVDDNLLDRAELEESFNFILPLEWTRQDEIEVEARLDPFTVIPESNENNNETRTTLRFREPTEIRVSFKPVLAARPDGTDAPLFNFGDPGFWTILGRAESMMPMSRIIPQASPGVLREWDPTFFDPFRHGAWELDDEHCILDITCFEEDGVALLMLELEALGSGFAGVVGLEVPSYIVGMVHPESQWRLGGLAHRQFFANLTNMNTGTPNAFDRPFGGVTLAHELTHNFGFSHVSCDGSEAAGGSIDNDYPNFFPPCQIGNDTTDFFRVLGWDWMTRSFVEPTSTPFMSYSSPRWTSPYHWNRTLNVFEFLYGRERGDDAMPPSELVVIVTGVHDPISGEVRLHHVEKVDRAMYPEVNLQRRWTQQMETIGSEGPSHTLELKDGGGNLLDAVDFTPPAPACNTVIAPRPFLVLAPAEEEMSGVEVRRRGGGGGVVASRSSSAHAPVIAGFESPSPGQFFGDNDNVTVKWAASDADPDDLLTYTVQYSNDNGATWQTVAVRSVENSLTFGTTLPGSTEQRGNGSSLFRVIANDGLRTSTLESPTFFVGDRRPTCAIIAPADHSRYRAGESIAIRGASADPEMLILDGPQPMGYEWLINGNTYTHTATPNLCLEQGLAPGSHSIVMRPWNGDLEGIPGEITVHVGESAPFPLDSDQDQVPDETDNCPFAWNPNQEDADQDGVGDVCDNCILSANDDQTDVDDDGFGTPCDDCPSGYLASIATDGFAANYGDPLAVQDTQTGFGDNVDETDDTADGSELNEVYAFIDCDMLHIMITGNLASDGTNLDLFLDTQPGGQNPLVASPLIGNTTFERMTADENNPGFTFDTGFEPDYWLNLHIFEGRFDTALRGYLGVLDPQQPYGWFLGTKTPSVTGMLLGGDTSAPDVRLTVDNSNLDGVSGGNGSDDGSGVSTGIEIAIPLSAIGNPECALRLCSFITDAEHETVSNQFLPGIGGGPNLGEPRTVNLAQYPGDQFVEIERTNVSQPVGGLEGFRFEATAIVYAPAGHSIQWTRDNVPVVDDSRVSGAMTNHLVIDPVVQGDEGRYRAVVTTSCGSDSDRFIRLIMAPIPCLGDVNRDGRVDFLDLEILLDAWSDDVIAGADGDLDNSGSVNFVDLEILLEEWGSDCDR